MMYLALIVLIAVLVVAFSHETGHHHDHHDHHDHRHLAAHHSNKDKKNTVRKCGHADFTNEEANKVMQKLSARLIDRGISHDGSKMHLEARSPDKPDKLFNHKGKQGFNVPVHFTIVKKADNSMPTGTGGDYNTLVTNANLDLQINVLNAAYGKYNWNFFKSNEGVQIVNNDNIYNSLEMEQMGDSCQPSSSSPAVSNACTLKLSTHRGNASELNLWISPILNGILGYATFPYYQMDDDAHASIDGVVLHPMSLPNGVHPYDEGKTLVHEVGHWLGLFHTFQGGCGKASGGFKDFVATQAGQSPNSKTSRGDFIQDTPAEAVPYFGNCAKGDHPDTCPGRIRGLGGSDPIHNYMDYSEDSCLDEFTDDQFTMMHLQWQAFRDSTPLF